MLPATSPEPAVAKAFATEGATVFLAGRTENSLNPIAQEISSTGGVADVSKVDALNPESVEAHLQRIVTKAGKLDISFNLIGTNVAMGSRLTELSEQRFADAAFNRVRSCFITMTAAPHNEETGQRCHPRAHGPKRTTTKTEHGRLLGGRSSNRGTLQTTAFEVGPRGVRVVCLRTGGTPDNPVLQAVFSHLARLRGTSFQAIADSEAQITALKRAPLLPEVANAAVLIAWDYASAITATTANASCGELVD